MLDRKGREPKQSASESLFDGRLPLMFCFLFCTVECCLNAHKKIQSKLLALCLHSVRKEYNILRGHFKLYSAAFCSIGDTLRSPQSQRNVRPVDTGSLISVWRTRCWQLVSWCVPALKWSLPGSVSLNIPLMCLSGGNVSQCFLHWPGRNCVPHRARQTCSGGR